MNQYRGKHVSTQPWPVASTASTHRRGRHQQRSRRRRRWIIFLIVTVLLVLAYPLVEAHILTTERVYLQSADLPGDIGHLHIVFLCDIHYGFWFSDTELSNLVSRINQLKPDLVLFGGDYGADHEAAVAFFKKLPAIHARYAMLGVVGEADRGTTPAELEELKDAMRNAGVTPLVNEVNRVRLGNSSVYVAGLDEPVGGTPDISSLSARVSASDYVILLCHNPSVIPDTQLATDSSGRLGWYDLALFGHTHGGQVPLLRSLLDIAGDVPSRYLGGWLTENRVDMLVSRGVGTSVIPIRLFCLPQIHSIDVSLN